MAKVRLTSKPCIAVSVLLPGTATSAGEYRLPLLLYSNGSVCWEVSDYLMYLFRMRRLSEKTLVTYANNLSPWIDYLDSNRINFCDVTDRHLVDYASFLIQRNRSKGSQTNKLIRTAIKCLTWLQEAGYISSDTVGTNRGSAITISVEQRIVRGRFRKTIIRHPSMVEESIPKLVRAVSLSTVDALYEAVPKLFDDRGIQRRMEAILDMLLNTGGRRDEVGGMQVIDVKRALERARRDDVTPRIQLNCGKNGIKKERRVREIPIKISSLERLESYIQFDRAALIRRAIDRGRIESDHGMLWVNCWGRPTSAQSISDYVRLLRVRGGITDDAWPHMFRHRALTLIAIELIGQLMRSGIAVADVVDTLMVKLSAFSGHLDPSSLQVYFDTALGESETFTRVDKSFIERFQRDEGRLAIARLIRALDAQKIDAGSDSAELEAAAEGVIAALQQSIY